MSGAAHALRTNVATVSRRIERLTETMGETLFLRLDKAWEPTETCRNLISIAERTERQLTGLEASSNQGPVPGSVLRLTCDHSLMEISGLKTLPCFAQAHPELRFDLSVKPRSLAYAETDLVVGFNEPEEGRLVRQRIGALNLGAYAHSSYAETASSWVSIGYGASKHTAERPLRDHFEDSPRIWIESLALAMSLAKQLPVAMMLPISMGEADADLVPVPEITDRVTLPIWISYHVSRKLDPLVRVGIDMVQDCMGKALLGGSGTP